MAKHSADNGKTNGFGGKVGIQGGASNEGTGGDITVESGTVTRVVVQLI